MDCEREHPRELRALEVLTNCTGSDYRNVDPVTETVTANDLFFRDRHVPEGTLGLVAQVWGWFALSLHSFHFQVSSHLPCPDFEKNPVQGCEASLLHPRGFGGELPGQRGAIHFLFLSQILTEEAALEEMAS